MHVILHHKEIFTHVKLGISNNKGKFLELESAIDQELEELPSMYDFQDWSNFQNLGSKQFSEV